MAFNEVAIGHNNAAGLVTIQVQPDFDGIQFPREINVASGDTLQDGKRFVRLRFPQYVLASDWVAILAQFGLTTSKTALITIKLMDENKSARSNYNARAVKQEYGQVVRFEMCWYSAPEILVKQLAAL